MGVGSWEAGTGAGACVRAGCTAKAGRRKSRSGKGKVWREGWMYG